MDSQTRRSLLERYFHTVDTVILSRQDPVTGLLPASTAVNAHGDYTDAWVRDNVYSILCVWGLALAYRRHDPDGERSYTLSQSVVKLMRGLLGAMMRQADRVEAFKYSLDPLDALHAKYGTSTATAVVGDDEWGHLQLDATSLFLLMTAQMTASGLRLIYTPDEVDFIQNLVHYISRAYCTPDYGIWERGNKINRGTAEINCSSVGMAKAALEALDGFNLFGDVASHEAVIHVVASDISRARFTLHSLLPRESLSKETDAALLSVIGYPAYAVENEALAERTREKIVRKLAGNYGCKRFLLDGHQSVLEDSSRLHYEPEELRKFEHIESEWPLFFTYLLLDALMRNDDEAIRLWRRKLAPLFVEKEGAALLPELYYVPRESIAAEKADPGSRIRLPNENIPLVWAQSLSLLADMMQDGLLEAEDIDPLHRRRRIGYERRTVPLVPILAESPAVARRLRDLGITAETAEEVAPLQLSYASELTRLHTRIGQNGKLGLTGRPPLLTRTVTTARLYLLGTKRILFLPYHFNPKSFYFGYDNTLLVEHFRSSLRFLAENWDQNGRPLMPFFVTEEMLSDDTRETVEALLHELHSDRCGDIPVQNGPLHILLHAAAVERFARLGDFKPAPLKPSPEPPCCDSGTETTRHGIPLTRPQLEALAAHDERFLARRMLGSPNRCERLQALLLLRQRFGDDWEVSPGTPLAAAAEQLYTNAAACRDWAVVRRTAEITGKYDGRLEDVLLDIVVRQKRLAVGRAYSEQATFSRPFENAFIVRTIGEFCGNNTAERVLTEEIVLHLGHLIRNRPELFDGMLTLRTWYFVQLLVGQIGRESDLPLGEAYERLLTLAPSEIYRRLRSILETFSTESARLLAAENLHGSGLGAPESLRNVPRITAPGENGDWMQWRSRSGLIGKLPARFYKDVWYMLQQCRGLVIGDKYDTGNRIGAEQTLDTTAGEQNFALRVDTLLQGIDAPEYRQLNIEALESLSWLLRQNPQLRIEDDLVMDVLIGHAVRIAWETKHGGTDYNEQRARAWEAFYRTPPRETETAFKEAFLFLLGAASESQKEFS